MAYSTDLSNLINNTSGSLAAWAAAYEGYSEAQQKISLAVVMGRQNFQGNGTENVVTTNVITADENGKTFFLNLAGGFTSTLPAMFDGMYFRFIVKTVPTTAYIVAANAADVDTMLGHVLSSSGGAEDTALIADQGDQVNFVASTAVQGDILEVFSDGTKLYVSARCAVTGGITVTG